MRGSPLLQALAAFGAILLAGWPLWRLTHDAAASPPAQAVVAAPRQEAIHLQLSFTAAPSAVKVLHLGEEVWSAASPGAEVERELRLAFPEEGIDLQFEVVWPGDALCAMRARLTDPAGGEHERSVWGRGEVSEVVTFGNDQ